MNRGDQILSLIAVSTECSPFAVERIIPKETYRHDITAKLKREKCIRLHTGHGLKGYRLTAACRRRMLAEQPERYGCYLDKDINPHRTELYVRQRRHRISETLAMFMLSDTEIYPDLKPDVFRIQVGECAPLERPAFYLPAELQLMGDMAIKIKYARMVGLLLTSAHFYLVYNTGGALLRWTPASEKRAAVLLSYHFGRVLNWPCYAEQSAHAIMLGRDMTVAGQMLANAESSAKYRFVLDDTFERFHFIPNTPDGDILFRLLTRPALAEMLNAELARNYGPKAFGSNFEYDASNGDRPVLFCWDLDMLRIRNFRHALERFGFEGVAVAFDFQKPALEQYFGSRAVVRPISLGNAERWLIHEIE